MMVGVTFLFIVGCIVAILIANRKQAEKLALTFSWLGEKLGGGHDIAKRHAWGEVANAKVAIRFVVRGSGKHAQTWTEIEAEVPPQYPLRLFVKKHGWLDEGKIERGEMVDVQIGDPAFDEQFLVEAAPAEVARILLDPRERSYLLELSRRLWLEILTTRDDEGRAVLRLDVRSWVYDINDAMRAVEALAAIAGRLRAAYAAVDQTAEIKDVGTPYRPMLDDTAAKAAAEERLAEVERVDKVRTQRAASSQFFATVLVFLCVLIALVAIASSGG